MPLWNWDRGFYGIVFSGLREIPRSFENPGLGLREMALDAG